MVLIIHYFPINVFVLSILGYVAKKVITRTLLVFLVFLVFQFCDRKLSFQCCEARYQIRTTNACIGFEWRFWLHWSFLLSIQSLQTLVTKAYVDKSKINLKCYPQWGLNLWSIVMHCDALLTELTWQVLIKRYLTYLLLIPTLIFWFGWFSWNQ